MIGKKFHKLLVLENIGYRRQNNGQNRTYFKCQCECGKIIELQKYKIGVTKSCGCLKHNKSFGTKQLAGVKFGRLTVVREGEFVRVGKEQKRKKTWLCKCECGNELTVRENGLLSSNTKSCGCLLTEVITQGRFKDITNQRFGRLVVNSWVSKSGNHQIWQCVCDCGHSVQVRANNLGSGVTRSCGCYNKECATKHGLSGTKGYITYLRADPVRRLRHRVSCAIRGHFKLSGNKKDGSIFKYLPYTLIELKKHLESLFEPWMNWDNYGGRLNDPRHTWHIDHIIPQSTFKFTSMTDSAFIACWALSNLQPMEKIANVMKGCKV